MTPFPPDPFSPTYLKTLNITETRDMNQIANYALVEWGDNAKISDQPPLQYLPKFKARFSADELTRMYHWHALPRNWENLDYRGFLEQRREMIAKVIAEGYKTLTEKGEEVTVGEEFDLTAIIVNGESEAVEFKSTLRTNLHTGSPDPRIELSVLKTLAGFLNRNGGTLVIGVSDDGSPVGIDVDGFPNEDKMSLHFVNIVKSRMGLHAMTEMRVHFEDCDDSRAMVIRCGKAISPVFVKDGDIERFYIRTGPSTTELTASQTQEYMKQRFR